MIEENYLYDFFNKNKDVLFLPIQVEFGKDVFPTLFQRWAAYLALMEQTKFFEKIVELIKNQINNLKAVITGYFSGDMDLVKDNIQELIDRIVNRTDSHILADLDSLYIDSEKYYWFRARIGDLHTYYKNDMKHIPRDKRSIVKNYRYSINGIPCLYLSNSIYACWSELSRPSLDSLWVSRYCPKQSLRILNLSTTGFEVLNAKTYLKYVCQNPQQYTQAVLEYFSNWILQSACSVIVKETGRAFYDEYVIPQILMQNLKKYNLDGIMYFSTRAEFGFTTNTSWISKNLTIPAFDLDESTYSPKIDKLFTITNPLNVGLFSIGLDGTNKSCVPSETNSARTNAFVNVGSLGKQYCNTIFYRSEIELLQDEYL